MSITKNMGEIISKNVTGKYCQKYFGHAKESVTDVLIPTSRK